VHLSLFFAQKQTCFCIAHKVLYFSVFPEVADEPAAEKPAAEKQGSSNDRDLALARVETEKRNSLIKAWEENEKTKAENKYAAYLFQFP